MWLEAGRKPADTMKPEDAASWLAVAHCSRTEDSVDTASWQLRLVRTAENIVIAENNDTSVLVG
jgi:hypothetical protein